ncbi:MAG: crotonase/enoyl-CoA hydratase family protein [Ramlibacter sp.]|nr:crotonase/enoyl-CoA hydratase family protein [Ramlibacter sp.]
MSESVVQLACDNSIATLTLNSPGTRNAFTELSIVDALVGAVQRVQADDSVRVLVVTGAGPVFSSGGNIKHMRDRSGTFEGDAAQVAENYRRGIQRVPLAFHQLEVPAIAAVNGPAVGAGFDLTLMCDMRIASTGATFAESFVRVGIIPGDGGAWLLPRAVGWARACEMAFTGEAIDAQTALQWGLVSQVVKPDRLMIAARELALRIAANPPRVVRQTKRLMREGQRMELPGLLELSAALQGAAHQTHDHRRALEHMLGGGASPPQFKGD